MRFANLMHEGSWTLTEGDKVFDRHHLLASVRSCISQLSGIIRKVDDSKIYFFCVTSAYEALVAYCVASELRLLACVVPLNKVCDVISRLERDAVALITLPSGRSIPESLYEEYIYHLCMLPGEYCTELNIVTGTRMSARLVFSTSGSSGHPKLIVCDEIRLLANASVVAEYLELSSSDITLCVFPITYMYGLSTLLSSLVSGGHLHCTNLSNPILLLEMIRRLEISILPILGDWAIDIVNNWHKSSHVLPECKIINASDRLLRIHAEYLLSITRTVWNNFGQTEAGPRLFACKISRDSDFNILSSNGLMSVGWPVDDDIKIKVMADSDIPTLGQMEYSSPYAMIGYLLPNGTILNAPAWIPSGDLFCCTDSGPFHWLSRVGFATKCNGAFVPVYALLSPLIDEGLITSVEVNKSAKGHLFVVVVSKRDHQEIASMVRERLHSYTKSQNVSVQVLSVMPKTETGKYRRPTYDIQSEGLQNETEFAC